MCVETDKLDKCLLDAASVAYMLSITEDGVKCLHRCGKLEGRKCGRHLRWLPERVEAFAKSLFEDSSCSS